MHLAPYHLPFISYPLCLTTYHFPLTCYLLTTYHLQLTTYNLSLTHYFSSLTNYTDYLNPSTSYHLSFTSYQLSYPSLLVLLGGGAISKFAHRAELAFLFLRIFIKSTQLGRPSKAVNMVYSVKDQRHTRKCAQHSMGGRRTRRVTKNESTFCCLICAVALCM